MPVYVVVVEVKKAYRLRIEALSIYEAIRTVHEDEELNDRDLLEDRTEVVMVERQGKEGA